MKERLDGTVALVTGASSGIGEATARALASQGATVVAAARRRDRLDALVARIERDGGHAIARECDLGEEDQATALVGWTAERLGRLDTLINNAAVMLLGPVVDAPLASHVREAVRADLLRPYADIQQLDADDIADAITYIVTRPRRVAINEVLIRPTEQVD